MTDPVKLSDPLGWTVELNEESSFLLSVWPDEVAFIISKKVG